MAETPSADFRRSVNYGLNLRRWLGLVLRDVDLARIGGADVEMLANLSTRELPVDGLADLLGMLPLHDSSLEFSEDEWSVEDVAHQTVSRKPQKKKKTATGELVLDREVFATELGPELRLLRGGKKRRETEG